MGILVLIVIGVAIGWISGDLSVAKIVRSKVLEFFNEHI